MKTNSCDRSGLYASGSSGCPRAAVTFLPADAGMAAVLLLFFGADPVVSILTGAAAGRQSDRLWPLPLLFPLLCLLGAWIFFGGGSF